MSSEFPRIDASVDWDRHATCPSEHDLLINLIVAIRCFTSRMLVVSSGTHLIAPR
jgi:hypothetical protein